MIRCCRDRCEPGTECGCPDCSAKKYPQYAKQTGIEQMTGICRACQGMLVSRNGVTTHASHQTTCPGVRRE